jgi:hypothetical protein
MLELLAALWRRRAPRPSTRRGARPRWVPTLERLEDRVTPSAGAAGMTPAIGFAVVNDWVSGFQGQIAVTDNLPTPLSNWTLGFDFAHAITNLWNGAIVSHTGNHYVVTNAGYNATITPGATVTIGFLGDPGNVTDQPTNYTFSS